MNEFKEQILKNLSKKSGYNTEYYQKEVIEKSLKCNEKENGDVKYKCIESGEEKLS